MESQTDTATRIVEVAQKLMQERGYNAFSYADISAQVGIRKASVHYYFPNKSDLGKAALVHYRQTVNALIGQLESQVSNPKEKLEWFVQGYATMLREQNLTCLCGVLGSELLTLPEGVQAEVLGFFRDVETWLVRVFAQGIEGGIFRLEQPLEVEAQLFLGAIEGAMMVARAFGEPDRFVAAGLRQISHLVV